MPEEPTPVYGRPEAHDVLASQEAVRPPPFAWHVPAPSLTRLLVVSDGLALGLALLVYYWAGATTDGRRQVPSQSLALFAAILPIWLLGACLYGLYKADARPAMLRNQHEWVSLAHLAMIGTVTLLVVALATRIEQPDDAQLVSFAVSAVAFLIVGRVAARAFARHSEGSTQSAVIVGAGEVGQLVARKLLRHPEYGIELVGFVDTPPPQWRQDVAHIPVLGGVDDLAAIVRTCAVDRVIVAFSRQSDRDTLARVRQLVALKVDVDVVPRMFEMIGPNAGLPEVEGIPLVTISSRAPSAASLRVKRVIDIAGASIGLILAAPLFIWAAWRIPRESPGSVFYRQTRLGANMREFTMLKFRTMTMDADQSSHRAYVERTHERGTRRRRGGALQARSPRRRHPDRALASQDEPR